MWLIWFFLVSHREEMLQSIKIFEFLILWEFL